MSAYVVSDATMHKVVRLACTSWRCGTTPVRELLGVYLREGSTADACDLLGRRLFALNADAVNCRCGSGLADARPDYRFNGDYRPVSLDEMPKHYKALQCLAYQCAEGDVAHGPRYAEIVALQAQVADWIVNHMPAYVVAKWNS
jgi:hypothetical protein